jgi:hypothetical protein
MTVETEALFSLEEARRERDRDQKNAKNKHSRNILNANGK